MASFPHGMKQHHQRASSIGAAASADSAWFDEVYSDEVPVAKASHRRAVSDTLAFIDQGSSQQEEEQSRKQSSLIIFVDHHQEHNAASDGKNSNKDNNGSESPPGAQNNNSGASFSVSEEEHLLESSLDPNMDPKRARRIIANRQSAQRSRIRKLQYIAELEKSVNSLQMEVSTLTPQVSFLDHQRVLLNVDNNVLKQRIAALVQNVRLKDAHNDALRKEAERLRQLYQHQQLEMQQQLNEIESGAYLRDDPSERLCNFQNFNGNITHHFVPEFGLESSSLTLKYQ